MNKDYDFKEVEQKWIDKWNFTFKLDDRPIFSIDTPPPYVSGHPHIGHAKNYSEFEIIARYKRMRGYNVFFPFGFDDNGVPTEKYIESKGITYDIGREKFVDACLKTVDEMIKSMTEDFKRLGLSCDWSTLYHTISPEVQRYAQYSFIDLYKKGYIYRAKEPVMWCPKHKTALAQAVVEDKKKKTKLNYIYFEVDGEKLPIATTRPELLGSCVGVFIHPEDKRYKKYVGKTAKVPLFDLKVPIMEDEAVDPEFGTGVVMICTFGDTQDIEWWKKYKLPLRISITEDGKMNKLAGKYKGLTIEEARKRIIEDLKKEGILTKQEDLEQTVGTCWRCGTPVEYLVKEQWFVDILSHKEELLEQGKKIKWHPEYYFARYKNWIENLKWNWCISRQRYYGVKFPVWYCKKCGKPKIAEVDQLPVDPFKDKPKTACECGSTDFIPEDDVMDTWMTSSLTPMITSRWLDDKKLFESTFPSTIRPQSHDIIRTWAFYTIVKAYYHLNEIPWENVILSGFVYAGKGVKMSKSLGTGINLRSMLDQYGADVVRYWATTTSLGEDMTYKEQDLIRGKKLVRKIWNAARFISMHLERKPEKTKLKPVDRWILSKLTNTIKDTTKYMDEFNIGKARKVLENFFMNTFCDNYLEMVKYRLYSGKDESALYTLYTALDAILRMFAPIMPFVTEEIYTSIYGKSIHKQSWPSEIMDEDTKKGDTAVEIITRVRAYKSQHHMSQGSEVDTVYIKTNIDLQDFLDDIKNTVRAKNIEIEDGNKLEVIIS